MFRPRWRKVLTDLLESKLRTALVVFSIAVGVISIGVIAGAYVIIRNDMSVSYAANNPANIELRSADFDEQMLTTVRNDPSVAAAEGRRVFNIRARAPGSQKWVMLDIVAVDDFAANQVNLLNPVSGLTRPGRDEIVLERDVLKTMDLQVGDTLSFQLPDGSVKSLPVVGIIQDPATGAGDFLAPPFAYIHMDTLIFFRQPELYNRIFATVAAGNNDSWRIRQTATALKDRLERAGLPVYRSRFSKTNEHPLAPTVNAILGILLALGVLIVFLSSSLIANTLSALLNQHLRHIGVIKLVGGRNHQVFVMYVALILSFGLLALLLAVPLGGQGAYALAEFIASEMSIPLLGYRIVPLALAIQIAVGLLVPLVAGLLPVLTGSRITVLEAISGDAGRAASSSAAPSEGRQARLAAWLGARGIHLPRPLLISLRNTFRRRGRLALTLFTLTMGGAIFISVFNVRVTLDDYMNLIGKYFLADVTLDFDRPYRLNEVVAIASQVAGVEQVEGWAFVGGELLYPDGTTAENLNLLAPPARSALVAPILVAGRWMAPEDQKALAVSETAYKYYPDLQPGDRLPIKLNGQTETWQVVGIFKFIGREGVLAYAPYEYVSRQVNLANRAYSYRVVTRLHDRPYQEQMSEALDRHFRDRGFHVREARPGLASLDTAAESLDILVTFLLIMALLTATVGSMGLTGTMGMNVLERTREIGIMRAIGAVDREIMRMVIVEGLVIGLISWLLAALLSFPFTVLLSTIVSLAIFDTPIDLVFTPSGFLIWLALVLVLSAFASVLPARNAARLTIREVLAYE